MAWWKRKKSTDTDDAPPRQAPQSQPVPRTVARLQGLKARFDQWRRGARVQQLEPGPETVEQAEQLANALFVHGDAAFAFGLNWQLLEKGKKQTLQTQALQQGYTHHVLGIESEQIGFLKLPHRQRDKRPIHSAALLLSETVSLGGEEVFAFRLDESRYALVALKNSMPVPGFDLIGNMAAIARASKDYLSLPHKTDVRRCGDAEILSGAETFDFSVSLEAYEPSQPRLKTIPDVRKLLVQGAVLAGVVLVMVLGWAGWSYFEAKEETERLQRESDPNMLYEQNFLNSSSAIRGLGMAGLQAMTATLTGIPVDVGGWALSGVACLPAECVATWTRQYGSYADFDAHLPADVTQKPEYGFITTDVKSTQLKTRHPVAPPASSDAKGLKREALPLMAVVQSAFVSRLQDYTLIDAKVQVSPPTPFPNGVADIGPIFKPVVSGTWSIELPLWTMDSLTLPDYVQVDSLSLDMGSVGANRPESSIRGAKNYKITGKYYAKGKVF